MQTYNIIEPSQMYLFSYFRQQLEALEDHRQRQQMHIEDSKQSHEKHQKYLSATMEKYVKIKHKK